MSLILTFPRSQAPALPEAGCWAVHSLDFLQPAGWRERADVEHDETWLQPIAYLVLHDAAGSLWCYRRSGGDTRLAGRFSCGVGGHVETCDRSGQPAFNPAATLQRALERELSEELQDPAIGALQLRALIHEGLTPVGRVHLGVLYTARWCGARPPQPRPGQGLQGLGFRQPGRIADDLQFEHWSRLAANYLQGESP